MDCRGCPQEMPELLARNRLTFWVYLKLRPALWDGMGGINMAALDVGLRRLPLPAAAQTEIFEKLLMLLTPGDRSDGG